MRHHLNSSKMVVFLLLTVVLLCLCVGAGAEGHEHVWGNKTLIRAATCKSRATYQYTCEICNEKMEKAEGEVDLLGHDYGSWVVVYPATATSAGMEERECRLCHLTAQRTIPALGQAETEHSWDAGVRISEANCGSPAMYEFTCTKCGAKKQELVGSAAEHEWGEWIIDVEPTANTTGLKHRFCKRGHREDAVISSLSLQHQQAGGHTWEITSIIYRRTCTRGEWVQYTCPVCGATKLGYEGDPDPSAHEWSNWMVQDPPTATEPGVEVRYCIENMEHMETRPIPALGDEPQLTAAPAESPTMQPTSTVRPTESPAPHQTTLVTETPAPQVTATEPPETTPQASATPKASSTLQPTVKPQVSPTPQAAATASVTATESPDHTHEWGEWIVDVKPSCKEPGKKHRICLLDPAHREDAMIPAGHDLQWRIRREATTEAYGLRQLECIVCGEVVRVNRIPRLPEIVPIDAEHFPDSMFRQYISDQFDKDLNGSLSSEEASAIWIMVCRDMGIKDLKGIEFFPGLVYFDCSGNELTVADLSGNMKLKTLIASRNTLTELLIVQDTDLCRAYEEGEKTASEDGMLRYVLDDISLCLDADTTIVVVPIDFEDQ